MEGADGEDAGAVPCFVVVPDVVGATFAGALTGAFTEAFTDAFASGFAAGAGELFGFATGFESRLALGVASGFTAGFVAGFAAGLATGFAAGFGARPMSREKIPPFFSAMGRHVLHEVCHATAISPLVVVPGDNLHELIAHHHRAQSVNDR